MLQARISPVVEPTARGAGGTRFEPPPRARQSARYVIYYTLYRMDPQNTHYKNMFFRKNVKNQKLGNKSVYIPPLTPDQPPLKGGYLCFDKLPQHIPRMCMYTFIRKLSLLSPKQGHLCMRCAPRKDGCLIEFPCVRCQGGKSRMTGSSRAVVRQEAHMSEPRFPTLCPY